MFCKPILSALLLLNAVSTFSQSQISDADGNTAVQTEATPNEDKIRFKTGGAELLIMRRSATGFTLLENVGNNNCLFLGEQAGQSDVSGTSNVFMGYLAGRDNTSGGANTFVGAMAGMSNTTANNNTFVGKEAGLNNTTGFQNTIIGTEAGKSTVQTANSTFVGYRAGFSSTAGLNTFVGSFAGQATTTGVSNVFVGTFTGQNNTTGLMNIFIGNSSGGANTIGIQNTAVGNSAGSAQNNSTACTFLGNTADATLNGLSNSTALGNGAKVNASNKIRFGNSAVTVVEGNAAYTVSDGRFKRNLRADAPGLTFIMGLRPVTYQFDYTDFSKFLGEEGADQTVLTQKEQVREMGFVAQDVERLCADQGVGVGNLVHVPDSPADNYSLAYGQMVVPLVQAMQEQQAQIEALQAQIEELKKWLPAQPSAPATAVNTPSGRSAAVFPNPATDALNIRLNGFFTPNESAQVLLADAAGRIVLRQTVPATGASLLPLSPDLPAGHYAVTVQAQNGELLFSGLILKQ